MKVPSDYLLTKIILKKTCYNCNFWTRQGDLEVYAHCKKHKEDSPVCGYCPLWELNKKILTVKILAKKILER